MQTTKAEEITASALVGADSPTPLPVKKPRTPWPSDVPIKPTYPGSKVARHPLDKGFIKIEEALAQGGKLEATAPEAKPGEIKATDPAQPAQPATAPAMGDTAPGASGATAPAMAAPEAEKPKFDATPGAETGGPNSLGDNPGAAAGASTDALDSYEVQGVMYHGIIEGAATGVFGPQMKTDEEEKAEFKRLWVKYLAFIQAKIFSPGELLAMAYGKYLLKRGAVVFGKIRGFVGGFLASRKASKAAQPSTVPQAKPAAAQPAPEKTTSAASVENQTSMFEAA